MIICKPYNICEQSTRYCNFTREKFRGDVRLCEPHWLNVTKNVLTNTEIDEVKMYVDLNNNIKFNDVVVDSWVNTYKWPINVNNDKYPVDAAKHYLIKCFNSCLLYEELVGDANFLPQDARGVLPLDTATKVVYTYSLKEWKHILDLRYYGITGVPHSNAKIAANLIRLELNKSQKIINFKE